MSQNSREDPAFFHCTRCKELITLPAQGTEQRNHCPKCLWSLHVDHHNGDRRSACKSPMEPIAVCARLKGEWSIIHRCTGCGTLRMNRIAGDDSEVLLLSLALRPIALPAFPLERVGQ